MPSAAPTPSPGCRGPRTWWAVSAALALLGCPSIPLRPEPNLALVHAGQALPALDDFDANLQLTDAILQLALRPPTAKELVDVQIAAMDEHVRTRIGRIPVHSGGPAYAAAPAELERQRLASAALTLLPYLDIDSGEAELGRAAASALAKQLGNEAEYLFQPPPADRGVEAAADLRDGIGVIRLRRLSDGMAERVLGTLNQWAALPQVPQALLLDLSECRSADAENTATVVNALAPGVTAFGFEYRDQESARIKQSAWRGDAEWGIAAFAKTPLFLWVSSHSTELVEAAATTLREERGAILLGEKTTGTGRLKHWQRLSKDRWFGFTVANVLDGRGAPLRDRPLYPDACPASGDFVPLQERSEAGYTARCLDPGMPANLEAALRYVSVAAKKTQ